jgi:hypothetical protein
VKLSGGCGSEVFVVSNLLNTQAANPCQAGTGLPQIDGNHRGPQARVLAFKPFEKNTLRGFFDLELPSGMILAGCTLHEKDNKYWVGLPAKPYMAADGSQSWVKIIDFRDAKTRARFQEEVTPLARNAYEHHAGARL